MKRQDTEPSGKFMFIQYQTETSQYFILYKDSSNTIRIVRDISLLDTDIMTLQQLNSSADYFTTDKENFKDGNINSYQDISYFDSFYNFLVSNYTSTSGLYALWDLNLDNTEFTFYFRGEYFKKNKKAVYEDSNKYSYKSRDSYYNSNNEIKFKMIL